MPELFTFVADPRVSADNNAAERSLCPPVVNRKISGGTRSEQGSEEHLGISVRHLAFARTQPLPRPKLHPLSTPTCHTLNCYVYIDGDAGTTGLQIVQRLSGHRDIDLITSEPCLRRDVSTRTRRLNEADVVILCLPDGAALEAVRLISNDRVRIIDMSSAHRVAEGWVYGMPEYGGT